MGEEGELSSGSNPLPHIRSCFELPKREECACATNHGCRQLCVTRSCS